jgi:Fe-Mn family superoxide dismutase
MPLNPLPPLPYALDALSPHISKETLEYHHGKHHRAYVDKFNELAAGTEYADLPLELVVKKAQGEIFNNAAQAWNHNFYWNCLAPDGGGEPPGDIAQAINSQFGTFADFKKQFSRTAIDVFGSGWAWLVKAPGGSVAIRATANAQTPLTTDDRPLLTCDVWEHAYYVDHRNSRQEYLNAYWALVNWKFAERNFRN